MINWLKKNLEQRLAQATGKYHTANKCNDTHTMTGMKFIIAELESLLADISQFEEREWKYKILSSQVQKEFKQYNLSQAQVAQLVSFIINQNLSVSECKELVQIVVQQADSQVE